MKPKHTPWEVDKNERVGGWAVINSRSYQVILCKDKALACLIASAHKLLEALQVIKGQTEDNFSYETEYDGMMILICLFCGKQDGRHSEDCIKEKVEQTISKAEG